MSTEIAKQNTQFDFFNADQFAVMQRVSTMFSNSELVPDIYKTTQTNPAPKAIANCMIALSLAHRMGADPLMVMQQLIIIYGRPSWSSKFLIATVNTCGRFKPLQFKFRNLGKVGKMEITEYEWDQNAKKKVAKVKTFDGTAVDNMECIAYTSVKGDTEVLESSDVTIKLAIEEGWYTKNGSKWKTMTKQMLMYRAASFWTSIYAPEISMGLKTVEEVQDFEDTDYEDVSEKVTAEIKNKGNKTVMDFEQEEPPVTANANLPKASENTESNPAGLANKPEIEEGPGY